MNSIQKMRNQIDSIDNKILRYLVQRGSLAKEIGWEKSKSGAEVYSSSREREILDRLIAQDIAPFKDVDVEAIFQEVFNACRNLQKQIKVAYFGPEATFTHQLALKHFGKSALMLAQKTISDVFLEVEKGRADYGVVPVENSTEGVVNHTLDMFMESDLMICAARQEPISHYLLSSSGDIKKIKRIFSHRQALAQCRRWLETRLPHADVQESVSTADAASQASLDGSAAAVASLLAAKLYHLKVVAPQIEDFQENFTRFLIIGRKSPARSGKDKTSLLLSIKDRIGALNDILQVFKNHNINLTKIESRPTKKKAWQYIFFVDILGHSEDPSVQALLVNLRQHCLDMKILGSYPI